MQQTADLLRVMGVVVLVILTTVGMPGSASGGVLLPVASQNSSVSTGADFVPSARRELRETNALDHWELVDLEEAGPARTFVEVERFVLLPLAGMEQAGLADLLSAVLIGRVVEDESYLVGVMGEVGSGDSASARAFLVFARTSSRAVAVEAAREFSEGYNRQHPGYSGRSPNDPMPFCDCEDCGTTLTEETNACSLQNNLCIGEVLAGGLACAAVCGGVPLCEGACAAAVVLGIWRCNSVHASCVRAAVGRFEECESNCND
jgi:hypothetical protein